jgi:chaperonin cofactor prefoldin
MDQKDVRIKQLEDSLSQEIAVKKSEVFMNADLKEYNEKLELRIETLLEICEKYSNTISKLRAQLKLLIDDKNIR